VSQLYLQMGGAGGNFWAASRSHFGLESKKAPSRGIAKGVGAMKAEPLRRSSKKGTGTAKRAWVGRSHRRLVWIKWFRRGDAGKKEKAIGDGPSDKDGDSEGRGQGICPDGLWRKGKGSNESPGTTTSLLALGWGKQKKGARIFASKERLVSRKISKKQKPTTKVGKA